MTISLKKAVFFDRDGVLNEDTGYPHRPEDCRLIKGASKAIRYVSDQGYHSFIVTNQGGIALGLFTEADMDQFHHHLLQKLEIDGGAITAIKACPHHPNASIETMQHCNCRKPSPNMIIDLANEHGIDLKASIMIGDRQTDVEAGEAAGCKAFLFSPDGRLDEFVQACLENITV